MLYFRNGFTPDVRQALVRCFKQYNAAIEEYQHALEVAAGQSPSKAGPLRWFYSEGEEPTQYDKAPGFESLARSVPANKTLAVAMTSAEHKLAAGFYEFTVFALSDWKAERKRGLDGRSSQCRARLSCNDQAYSKRCSARSLKRYRRSAGTAASP